MYFTGRCKHPKMKDEGWINVNSVRVGAVRTHSFQFLAAPPLKALHAGRLSFVKIVACFVFTLYVYMIL